MDEIRVQIRLRNNRLITLREELGWSQDKTAAAIGISASLLCAYETMRRKPLGRNKDVRPTAQKICNFYGVELSWVFPEVLNVLDRVCIETTITADRLLRAREIEQAALDTPYDTAEQRSTHRAILQVLDTLTPRENFVIKRLYGLGDGGAEEYDKSQTSTALGEELNLCHTRIRQIECAALRKLRHPYRAKTLRDLK